MKKKSPTYYRKKCVTWAKLEARKRDGDRCQYCGRAKPEVVINGSHVLPEGAYPLMSAEPYNIIALCSSHHTGGVNPHMNRATESWHSHPMKFAKWFEEKWPGRYKELRVMADEKLKHIVNWELKWEQIKSNNL